MSTQPRKEKPTPKQVGWVEEVRKQLSSQGLHQPQKDDCTNNGDNQAPYIKTCNTPRAKKVEDKAAYKGTNDTHHNVHQGSLFFIGTHDLTGNPTSQCANDNPGNDIHDSSLPKWTWLLL
jgi:hypothetical protein